MEEGQAGRGALGGFLLGINRNTAYPEAALAWTRFLVGEGAQKIIGEQLGLTPARKNAVSQLNNAFPLEPLLEIMEGTTPRPATPLYMPHSQSMQAYISGALAGVYSIEQAVRLMESDGRRILRMLSFKREPHG